MPGALFMALLLRFLPSLTFELKEIRHLRAWARRLEPEIGQISRGHVKHGLICFDLSTAGTIFSHSPLRSSIKNSLLLSLWVCGREARECGQPVGRAFDELDVSRGSCGAVHGLSTRLCSGRSAGMRTRPHIHRLASNLEYKHIGSGHTRQTATVDHADIRGLGTT